MSKIKREVIRLRSNSVYEDKYNDSEILDEDDIDYYDEDQIEEEE